MLPAGWFCTKQSVTCGFLPLLWPFYLHDVAVSMATDINTS